MSCYSIVSESHYNVTSISIHDFHPSSCWEYRTIYWLRCALSGVFNELVVSKSCQGSRTWSSGSGTASIRFFFLGKCQEEKKKERKRRESEPGFVGLSGGRLPNWKRFSVGEGRHQRERSVSKETRQRVLVWRGPSAPMGLRGKGAGAQHRYTIERRYQRFLDLPWRICCVF